ncbi:MAG: hypothetical protein B7Z15_06890 [Rhizobiales bacterium 32-66-8]|nr:MAG: hypothetical protein B7Z15_06890 [Rhizobiales bacterium 32-66-8]
MTALAAGQPNVAVFLPRPLFCDAQVCRPTLNGLPVFTDGGHLNVGGSEHLIGPLRAAIDAQMAGAPAR